MAIKPLSNRETIPSPSPGIGVIGGTFYVHPTRPELMCQYAHIKRSDTKEIGPVAPVKHGGDR